MIGHQGQQENRCDIGDEPIVTRGSGPIRDAEKEKSRKRHGYGKPQGAVADLWGRGLFRLQSQSVGPGQCEGVFRTRQARCLKVRFKLIRVRLIGLFKALRSKVEHGVKVWCAGV